jgi:hypothetical protein
MYQDVPGDTRSAQTVIVAVGNAIQESAHFINHALLIADEANCSIVFPAIVLCPLGR